MSQENLERIAKIMAKASDRATTPAEAETLMRQAKKMADKLGLSIEDIKAGKVNAEELGASMFFGGESCLHPAISLLSLPVFEYCGVKGHRQTMSKGHWVVLFGHDADVELAKYLLTLFKNTLDEGWAVYKRYTMQPGLSGDRVKAHRKSFVRGFCVEIGNRLKAHTDEIIESTGTELIILKGALIADKYADYLRNSGLVMDKASRRNMNGFSHEAAAAGQAHAKSVDMGRGVGGKAPLQIGR